MADPENDDDAPPIQQTVWRSNIQGTGHHNEDIVPVGAIGLNMAAQRPHSGRRARGEMQKGGRANLRRRRLR